MRSQKQKIFANQSLTDWFVGNLDDSRIAELHWRRGDVRAQARQLWFTLGAVHDQATMYLRDGTLMYAPVSGDPKGACGIERGDLSVAALPH